MKAITPMMTVIATDKISFKPILRDLNIVKPFFKIKSLILTKKKKIKLKNKNLALF